MRNRENISLGRLISFYADEQNLKQYQSITTLKEQLIDLKTIFQFVSTNFQSKVKTLKKKPDDYLNNLQKAIEILRAFAYREVPESLISMANEKLAYDILSQSTCEKIEISSNQDNYNIEFEMKLKFLESQGLQPIIWTQCYDRSLGILVLGDQKFKINVGLDYRANQYQWKINSVLYLGKNNYILTQYYQKHLLPWVHEQYKNDGEKKILKYLIKSVAYCQSVLLFRTIEQKYKNNNTKGFELDNYRMFIKINEKKYQFIFPKVQRDDNPYFKLIEGQREILSIPIHNNLVVGTLNICSIILLCDFISHKLNEDILIKFVRQIDQYERRLKKAMIEYGIKFEQNLYLVLKSRGNYWKSQNLKLSDNLLLQTKKNGLYLVYEGQLSQIVIEVISNSILFSNYIHLGEINSVLQFYPIKQLFHHIELRKQFMRNNSHFQFKIYNMKLNQQGSVYLFKQHKFFGIQYSQNIQTGISRSDREKYNNQKNRQNNIIKIYVEKDFKKIQFTCFYPMKTETEIPFTYHLQEWKNYIIMKKQNEEYLSIQQIIRASKYILVHFTTLRFYELRVTDRDKQSIKMKLM